MKSFRAPLLAATLCALVPTLALAQPGDKTDKADKGDKGSAKALLASGLKLFAAKDYLGALAVFKDAYARFPSNKILLNIGTTLVKLDRPAEAANAYQRYLDSPDADATKRDEITRVLGDLDKRVGIVEITVEPTGAEVKVGDDEWRPAAEVARVRVMPGAVTIRGRKAGFRDAESAATATAGAKTAVALKLAATPVATTTAGGATTTTTTTTGGDLSVGSSFQPERRARFGMVALAHVDPSNKGGAAVVGAVADIWQDRLSARAAAILGPYFGGYVGATFAVLTTRVRPIIVAAVPVFRSEGWRVAIRGAGGVELAVNRHLSVIAELGVEHLFNPQDSVDKATLFVPALGVSGRL